MGATVNVNVYDLSSQNSWSYYCGVGIFHSGVEVYGVEYAFGGHDWDATGVFATNPRDAPGPVVFRESIEMGETSLSRQEVEALVVKLGQQYRGNKYHLLQRNCNHFTSDLCAALVGRAAPGWINRLAGVAVALHCLIPPSWVPPLDTPSASPDKAGGPETGVFSPPRAPGPARVAAVTTQRSSRAAGGCSSADASPRAGLGSDNMREALIDATTSSRSDVMVVSTSTYTSPQRSVASHLPPESGVGVVSPTSVRVTMAGSSGGGGGASSQDGGRSAVVSPSRSGITSPTSRA